jgi:AcrR family transcriptional regulator
MLEQRTLVNHYSLPVTTPKKRPAHRPSRRTAVVEAAMRLFASPRSEAVTVAEIAEASGMTSAAVYYHFSSKDDILLEGLRSVGQALVDETARVQRTIAADGASIGMLPVQLLTWFDERRDDAMVWFVSSAGVTLAVEEKVGKAQLPAMRSASMAVSSRNFLRPSPVRDSSSVSQEAAVVAVALLSLIETAASSWLTEDESLTGLGRKKFLDETAMLAERIAGS